MGTIHVAGALLVGAMVMDGCSSNAGDGAASGCDAGETCASGGYAPATGGASAAGGAAGGATGGTSSSSSGGTGAGVTGGTTSASGGTSSSSGGSSAGATGGAPSKDGGPVSSCVPAVATPAWTSPYAKWTRGIPTDPGFFPIAVWLQGSWHADELHQLGINIYVGNNAGTDEMASSDLATIKKLGMYAIVGQDSVGLANIDDPTIVGWWMSPDEPDNAQPASGGGYGPPVDPATLVTQYNAYKAADSTRPIYLGLGQGVAFDNYEGRGSNPPAESGYVPASDIIDFDIYPYNNCGGDQNSQTTCGEFWLNALGIDRLHQWSNRNQAAWTDIETTIIGAGTTTGPTPTQTKSETWLSIIHGANGIAYFLDTWEPSFQEDGIFKDAAMVAAVTALNQQITALAPVLNSASLSNIITVASSNTATPIDTMVKAHAGSVYVFAAVSRKGTTTGTFTASGVTGNGKATVVGEQRTVDIKGGVFSDAFAENDVHIYQLDPSMCDP